MKTLDEVIDIFEAYSKCRYDLYEGPGQQTVTDALHYLRQLQLFRQTPLMQGIHKAQKEYALYPVEDWGEENLPLTWDELKSMQGKPVWMEVRKESGVWLGEWCLVTQISDWMISTVRCSLEFWNVRKNTIGETWQAYRKERK